MGAPIDPELTADAEEGGDVGPHGCRCRHEPTPAKPPARASTGRSAGSAQARPGCTRAAACVARKVRGARADRGARGGIRGLGAVEGT